MPGSFGRAVFPRRVRGAFAPLALAALAALAALVACGSPAPRPIKPEFDLHNPDPTRRTMAAATVAAQHDTARVPDLILLLDDRDEAVRLAAGSALRDVTKHDTGYRASASQEERIRQMELWRAWWSGQGKGAVPPPKGGTHVGSP